MRARAARNARGSIQSLRSPWETASDLEIMSFARYGSGRQSRKMRSDFDRRPTFRRAGQTPMEQRGLDESKRIEQRSYENAIKHAASISIQSRLYINIARAEARRARWGHVRRAVKDSGANYQQLVKYGQDFPELKDAYKQDPVRKFMAEAAAKANGKGNGKSKGRR